LAEASEREEMSMSVPNIGPEHPDPNDHEEAQRGGNAALVYRDDMATDDVQAASTRASAVTHRFGGVRYALSRPGAGGGPRPAESFPQPGTSPEDGTEPDDGGESDAGE
jgi:hypothetical protein